MTGFGRVRGELSKRMAATVVLRSVNHRALDIVVRAGGREELPELEAAVRAAVSAGFARGRVTVQVGLERLAGGEAELRVDAAAVAGLIEQLDRLELPGSVDRAVRLSELIAVPGVVSSRGGEAELSEDELEALAELVGSAVAEAVAMRRREGERLLDQLREELAALEVFLDWLEPLREEVRQRLFERLQQRVRELVDSVGVETERIAQEAALAADRADVAEEVVRLRSHLEQFRDRLGSGGPVGRQLDFLCQEIHRELNTLGAKCREVGVAERLVDAKTAVERLREQVQNLE
jgi:uncharacterized protein (TIGR00255 family)